MGAQHTSGPFSVEPQEDGCSVSYRIVDRDGQAIASTYCVGSGKEEAANASLFAAAPEMLAVLRSVEWEADTTETGDEELIEDACPACRRAKSLGHDPNCALAAVIAKAEGRS